MHTLTILQRFLNAAHDIQPNFLKFCYFLLAFALISCGNETKTIPQAETALPTSTDAAIESNDSKKIILCFGDSITAGYGLDDTNDAYPAVLQAKIDSLGADYVVVDSGVSGETSAGGNGRIQWVLKQKIDIFILELGANDGLRGVPLTETKANLQAIIDAVHIKDSNIIIILTGMELPPNMGQDYTTEFRAVFADLATTNNLPFIPFILKDVGGIPALNQSDGIHPNIAGHKIVANTVWEVLETVIKL